MIRIWDALVWILVIIPLVTGGFWFKKPGLSIELSQINAPVILLGVWAAVLHFRFRSSLKDASSVRLASELWAKWCDWTSRSPRVALWSGALFFGLLMAWGAVQRHHGFGSHAEDLGIFSNTLWNLTHGNGYVSSLKDGINLFQDHQSPILLTFAPFFRLFPSPVTLLILQALALACGGPALYFLFRQYRPEFDACRDPDVGGVFQTQRGFFQTYSPLLPLMYWSYLPTRNANHFDFHPEVVMLPLYLWTVWALQSSRARVRMSGFFLLLLSLACKESAGIVAAGLGAAWVLGLGPKSTQRWTRPLGAAVSLLGIAHFLFCLKVVPGLLGSGYAYMSTYSHLGSSLGEVLLSPIQKPEIFWPLIFQKNRMVFLLGTL
ncbi:MAG: DUF2079 domain-containing protein, partial [Methylotenera sp.]|nr:DUF2079 domain-containing protein [Oligoflexia bacterium]